MEYTTVKTTDRDLLRTYIDLVIDKPTTVRIFIKRNNRLHATIESHFSAMRYVDTTVNFENGKSYRFDYKDIGGEQDKFEELLDRSLKIGDSVYITFTTDPLAVQRNGWTMEG